MVTNSLLSVDRGFGYMIAFGLHAYVVCQDIVEVIATTTHTTSVALTGCHESMALSVLATVRASVLTSMTSRGERNDQTHQEDNRLHETCLHLVDNSLLKAMSRRATCRKIER
jgi:hypothetical protein